MARDPLMAGLEEDPHDPERTIPTTTFGPATLRVVLAGREASTVAVEAPGSWTVGRAKEADVRVDDPSLSRLHARLTARDAELFIEDLGSANGTSVEGRRLPPNAPEKIAVGEPIDLGSCILVVQRPHAPPLPPAPFREDPAMRALHRLAAKVAPTDIPVLITGETGVGKELLAEKIHGDSLRREGPLLRLNCAALSANLLESELFGHERGAYTGADEQKRGLLECAGGGTVLLDEVGELPLELQAKLLRVVEERALLRLGSLTPIPIDVRFISVTNRDLAREVDAGRFRRDLYYRLSGFVLEIPPLRERRSQILDLAQELCGRALSDDARAALLAYSWPGNVRELKNVMKRAALLAEGAIEREHLSIPVASHARVSGYAQSEVSGLTVEESAERERIIDALDRCIGNQTRAAELLGISRRTLIGRMDRYGLPRPRKR